jgi:hypothetical protein
MKMKVFLDISPCSLAGVDRRFRRAYCVHHQGAISQYTLIFTLDAMRTSNLNTVNKLFLKSPFYHGREKCIASFSKDPVEDFINVILKFVVLADFFIHI